MGDTLRDCGESALLEEIRRLVPAGGRVVLGPGDDAAVLTASRHRLLLTTDTLIEGVHFRRHWLAPRALGRRAFEVSASDLAAMGGHPIAALLELGAPAHLSRSDVRAMVQGVRGAAEATGAALAGGNLAQTRSLSLAVALLGEAPVPPIPRSGGRPGDRLFVTGTLGGAALGLRALARVRSIPGSSSAVRRWQRPKARLREGYELARRRIAVAMIDVSDGLLIDAGRLCAASRVGAELLADRLPLATSLRGVARRDALALALTGGEDYELLFAVRPTRLGALRSNAARLGCRVSEIGRLVRARGVRVLDSSGCSIAVPRRAGHQHFERKPQ